MSRLTLDNLVDHYDVAASGCWEWRGKPNQGGYGRATIAARTRVRAHRAVYEFLVGPIPDGLQIDHLCRNRICVNPDHLEPVTAAENIRRAKALITHCPSGHAYDEANTWRSSAGHRQCRACAREKIRNYTASGRNPLRKPQKWALEGRTYTPPSTTHCIHGHPKTPENRCTDRSGHDRCDDLQDRGPAPAASSQGDVARTGLMNAKQCQVCVRPADVVVRITWYGLWTVNYSYCIDHALRALANHPRDAELLGVAS